MYVAVSLNLPSRDHAVSLQVHAMLPPASHTVLPVLGDELNDVPPVFTRSVVRFHRNALASHFQAELLRPIIRIDEETKGVSYWINRT